MKKMILVLSAFLSIQPLFSKDESQLTKEVSCSLGEAANFGSFTFYDTAVRHSDISGRVAVGGTLSTNHFSLGCAAYQGHEAYLLKSLPPTKKYTVAYPEGFYGEADVFTEIPHRDSFGIFVSRKWFRGFGTSCPRFAAFAGKEKHSKVLSYETSELGVDWSANLSGALVNTGEKSLRYLASLQKSVINFERNETDLGKTSRFWGSLEANGKINVKEDPSLSYLLPAPQDDVESNNGGYAGIRALNRLTLEGKDPVLNIFRITESQILASRVITIDIPEGSTALINVIGTWVSFARVTMEVKAKEMTLKKTRNFFAARILWNFPEARYVETISHESRKPFISNELLGTFVAPYADFFMAKRFFLKKTPQLTEVHWFGSLITGAVIAKSLSIEGLSDYNTKDSDTDLGPCDVVMTRGNGQINQVSFEGILPVLAGSCKATPVNPCEAKPNCHAP